MTVFRAADVSFARDGRALITPFSLEVASAARGEVVQPDARAASIAARICAAIVKPTTGVAYVGDFETRLQPPQAKRMVGFVDAGGFAGDDHALRCEIAFRAEVWGVEVAAAQSRATALLQSLGEGPYARGAVLACVAGVALVVLDQPPRGMTERVRAVLPDVALVTTRVVA